MERKVFISHSSKDKEYGQAVADLLTKIGLKERVFFSSNVDSGIPVNQDIFTYLEKQIQEDTYVLFLLSEHFYNSIACMNEVGAVWGKGSQYALMVVPGFDISNDKILKSALNPRQMAAYLDDIQRVEQLLRDILQKMSLPVEAALIDSGCEQYMETIQNIKNQPSVKNRTKLADIEQKIKNNPDNPELYVKRGKLLLDEDKKSYYQRAIQDYLYAIYLDPDYADAYYRLVSDAVEGSDYKRSLFFAEKACRRFPKDGHVFGCRAFARFHNNMYLEAIEDCNKAISMKQNRWYYNTRGRAQQYLGNLHEALADFYTAHKLDSGYEPALRNLKKVVGKISYDRMFQEALESQKSDFNKSKMYLESIALADMADEKVWQEYGGLYYGFRKYSEAFTYFDKALQMHSCCKNYYLCALALKMSGKYEPALEYYRRALEFPDDGFRQLAQNDYEKVYNRINTK